MLRQIYLSKYKWGSHFLLCSFIFSVFDSMWRTLNYNQFYTKVREACVRKMNNFCCMIAKAAPYKTQKIHSHSLGSFLSKKIEKHKRRKLSEKAFMDSREVWGLRRTVEQYESYFEVCIITKAYKEASIYVGYSLRN